MKITRVSLFFQRVVENKDDLPSPAPNQTSAQLRQNQVKIANTDAMIVKLNFVQVLWIIDQLFIQHQLLVDKMNTKGRLVMIYDK